LLRNQKKIIAGTLAGGGLIGYLLGKLTPGDVTQLLNKILGSGFKFLEAQGPYATFTIFFSSVLVGICIWLVHCL
jgi:hypothetical protein